MPLSDVELLERNEGNYVVVEFLIGTQLLTQKEGILYNVGISYLVIYDPLEETYVICDMHSVKFVTIFPPNRRPAPAKKNRW